MAGRGEDKEDKDDKGALPSPTKTGRYSVLHRDGARVEVGDPIELPDTAERPWLCVVKLVAPALRRAPDATPNATPNATPRGGARGDKENEEEGEEEGNEFTQTLLVRTGRGNTPEEAQRDALNQLSLVYGTPNAPPPSVVITRKPSEPPPSLPSAKRPWFARIARFFGFGHP